MLPRTPVSTMRGFWGLMGAYWLSERWREAWGLTLIIIALTAAGSKTSVWIAVASGELVSSIATFHDPRNISPLAPMLSAAGTLVALVIFKEICFIGIRHLFSTTLHRKWRAWLNARFSAALLDANHTHFHVQHGGRGVDGAERPAPDNIDQRVQDSIKGMTGGAIGLAMGVISVLTSLFFVGQKLLETSTVVEGLEFLGIYGSALLAFGAVLAYVPANTWIAVRLGRVLERLNMAMQRAEGSYRSELTTLLRRSFHVAASRGEVAQKAMHDELYRDIDQTWGKLNIIHSTYMSFDKIYDFVAARVVAYGPGLIPYAGGHLSLKDYVTGAELVNSLIAQCSWFISVMPAIATLRANAGRVTGLARAIEDVQAPSDFYAATGRADFHFGTQHALFGLTVRHLELLHEGATAPFVTASNLRFRRGEWAFLKGDSGCGKTSMLKAINGLWPHGGGDVAFPEGVKSYYAAQDVKLPRISLKRLVCLPEVDDGHSDASVAGALHKAGLGEFIEYLGDINRDGKCWDEVLSGGQKQKLVLARILLHRPGLLFLDEATGALDPASKLAFHQALKDHCDGITVVSVMHEPEPPRSASGACFYDSVVQFENGIAIKRPLGRPLPPPIAVVPAGAGEEASARRIRFPHVFRETPT